MSLLIKFYSTVIISLLLLSSTTAVSYAKYLRKFSSFPHSISAEEPLKKPASRLSRNFIGDDGRVYACSGRNLFSFESNGTIAWTVPLNYTCNVNLAPVHGGSRKIYLVAENRVLKVNPLKIHTSEAAVEIFFDAEVSGEITGVAVSIFSSCVLINVENRGLFAYRLYGQLLWSAGPVLYQHGYRKGCRKNVTDCYFTSIPVIDHCEASIYISNTVGELYSLSVRGPHFKWIQDLSSFDDKYTLTPGNNGRLYVTIPLRAVILALDVSTGNILWEGKIGPLSSSDYEPVVDSNGWISIGSLDGFLYSYSPTGALRKFSNLASVNSVIQVSPVLDCSGYAVNIIQTEMDGKMSQTIGGYTYVSAMKPRNIVFTLLIPASGSIYWTESDPGRLSAKLSQGDLKHFILDERMLLAIFAASRNGNPLPCRTMRQKLASSCSGGRPKSINIYTGNKRTILLFLLFESILLMVLAIVVRYCLTFWKKKKLQKLDLGEFLEKRRSLRLQKQAFDRTITELEQKAAEEAVAHEVLEKLSDLVKEREGIKRKLSTTYSLGRDRAEPKSKSLLPVYNGKTKSYSFQGSMKESFTVFHTFSDSSSADSSSKEERDKNPTEHKELAVEAKGKGPVEDDTSSDDEIHTKEYRAESSLKGTVNPLIRDHSFSEIEEVKMKSDEKVKGIVHSRGGNIRKRSMSSTN
ncbi:protein GAMETE EXPRESSED 3-like [Olea europaea var. sylvestris]|uniref:protein GAMETE EXPRESSED 3-like n=1 Tax=Olea europaea var. sylvestris TaxID=158386 RepID=UPI000C1D1CD5|nr:protein GAMETE EXPRESSED 3-like [Olea europaea var. sylvestris]